MTNIERLILTALRRVRTTAAAGVLLMLCCLPAQATALQQADLEGLTSAQYSQRKSAIDNLAAMDPALAAPLLQGLADGRLYGLPDGRVLLKSDGHFRDPVSGEQWTTLPADARQPVLNNTLRRILQSALSSMNLFSTDLQARSVAVNNLLNRPQSLSEAQLEKALATETDDALRKKLDILLAFWTAANTDAPAAKRLQAVDLLGSVNRPQASSILRVVIDQEKNARSALSVAASASLDRIQDRRQYSAIANNVFTGLSLGSVLVLAALGLAVIYGLIGVINMAHGEFLMLGAYAAYLTQSAFSHWLPQWLDYYLIAALPIAFVLTATIGLLIEWLVIRHLYGRPLESLLATFGISLLLMQTVRLVFGAQNVDVANPTWMSGSFTPLAEWLPAFVVPYNRLIILFFSIAVVLALYLVLNRTRLGLFIRACTQNRNMAACVGIRTRKIDAYAFGLGAGIAGLGGVALSQIGNVGPDLGQAYLIDSFMAVVLGGVGQLLGTVVGAFGLGVLSKLGEPVMGAVLVKIAILLLIVAFIQKRPQGLFAQKGRSAAEA